MPAHPAASQDAPVAARWPGRWRGGEAVRATDRPGAARGSDAPDRPTPRLEFIGALYGIEREGQDLEPEALVRLRQQKAAPILTRFHQWLNDAARVVLPKSPMGQAIQHALNQWTALNRYTHDARLTIDNNVAERAIRPLVVGRKNWVFAGSDAGGERAAVIYSLIETCKQHDIDPFAYLADALKRLPTTLYRDLETLLPWNWAPQAE